MSKLNELSEVNPEPIGSGFPEDEVPPGLTALSLSYEPRKEQRAFASNCAQLQVEQFLSEMAGMLWISFVFLILEDLHER